MLSKSGSVMTTNKGKHALSVRREQALSVRALSGIPAQPHLTFALKLLLLFELADNILARKSFDTTAKPEMEMLLLRRHRVNHLHVTGSNSGISAQGRSWTVNTSKHDHADAVELDAEPLRDLVLDDVE